MAFHNFNLNLSPQSNERAFLFDLNEEPSSPENEEPSDFFINSGIFIIQLQIT